MAKKTKKNRQGVRIAKTGARAIADAAGIHRRGGPVPDKKKAASKKRCRTKIRP